MNVGFVTPVVYPFVKGGVEKRIHEVGTRMADRGHDITIYSRHWWNGPKTLVYEGMTLHAVAPASNLYANGDRRSVSSALELSKDSILPVLRGKHDIISTPVAPYLHVFGIRLATHLQATPLVVTWHEVWDDYWYQYMGWSGLAGKLIERATAKVPHHAVAPSEMTAKKLGDLGPKRRKIEIIPNGIDVENLHSTDSANEGFDILFAGRLIEDKNVGWLLDAFDTVAAHHDVTLGIIGDGPHAETLQTHAQRLDHYDRVTFLGFLHEYDDVVAHMQAAKLFVSPSTREGFGITLLEAMAADCTVITVKHPYSAGSEIVGDAGVVTDPTPEAVANALERALEGERPTRSPIEAAKRYDWDNITDATVDFYQSLT